MPQLPHRLTPAAWLVGILLATAAMGQEPSYRDDSTQKYRDLVRRLVSPNLKPKIIDVNTRAFPRVGVRFYPDYQVEPQQEIDAIRRELQANCESALPALVEALNNDHYCLTIEWMGGDDYVNCSVGRVCREIIVSHLEVYRDAVQFDGPGRWHAYNYPTISAAWLRTRRTRGLAALQLEAIDWAIAKHKTESERTVGPVYHEERAALIKLREAIETSSQPLPPNTLFRMVTTDKR